MYAYAHTQRHTHDKRSVLSRQVELLFELIDEDGSKTLTPDECQRFIGLCLRSGAITDDWVSRLM